MTPSLARDVFLRITNCQAETNGLFSACNILYIRITYYCMCMYADKDRNRLHAVTQPYTDVSTNQYRVLFTASNCEQNMPIVM